METVLYERKGKIAIITLNRPEVMNAFNRQLGRELRQTWQMFNEDDDAWVAIVTGAGRAFSAGRDLKERAQDNVAGVQATASGEAPFWGLVSGDEIWKPKIAAINGFAVAGGWSLAQGCDIRIASETAEMGIAEVRWNLLAPFAVTLPRHLNLAHVMEIVLTGERLSAQRALEIGFVNQVVPPDQLMPTAIQWAEKICKNGPLSVRFHKELIHRAFDMPTTAAAALTMHLYNRLLRSEDSVEGPKAFAEKREPVWKGR